MEVERDLLRSVQTILRELDTQRPDFRSNRGMWQWSLHKKIERDPRKSLALVRILLNELERVSVGLVVGCWGGSAGPSGAALSPVGLAHGLWGHLPMSLPGHLRPQPLCHHH
uniref:Uncharacterized protein n=1 Tax=Ornithorhynchus anatinus TaxID=9258 RepID=A0A6I8NDA7_ORNAN